MPQGVRRPSGGVCKAEPHPEVGQRFESHSRLNAGVPDRNRQFLTGLFSASSPSSRLCPHQPSLNDLFPLSVPLPQRQHAACGPLDRGLFLFSSSFTAEGKKRKSQKSTHLSWLVAWLLVGQHHHHPPVTDRKGVLRTWCCAS